MARANRHPVIIWSSDWSESTGQAIVTRRVLEHQTGVDWIHASYGQSGLRSVIGIFRAITRTYATLVTGRAQTIYLVCSRSTAGFLRDIPALAASLAGVRVVIHIHGSNIIKLLCCSPLAFIARKLYSRCELVVPSKHLIAPLQAQCRSKIHLCENFEPRASVADGTVGPRDAGPLIVWNSNIMASKGFFDVAEAVRLARVEQPDLRLVALGHPLQDTEMTAKAAQAALSALYREDWFVHVGSIPVEATFHWTARTDVLVFPSRHQSECQPLAVIQAMCLGRPLVLNDTAALRATTVDYPATLLTNPSIADLARTMLKAIRGGTPPDLAAKAIQSQARFSVERFDRAMATIIGGDAS